MSDPELLPTATTDPQHEEAMEVDESNSTAPEGMIVFAFFNSLLIPQGLSNIMPSTYWDTLELQYTLAFVFYLFLFLMKFLTYVSAQLTSIGVLSINYHLYFWSCFEPGKPFNLTNCNCFFAYMFYVSLQLVHWWRIIRCFGSYLINRTRMLLELASQSLFLIRAFIS